MTSYLVSLRRFGAYALLITILVAPLRLYGQELKLDDFLKIVVENHPYSKQIRFDNEISRSKVMEKRGAFDPSIEVDAAQKTIKEKDYYQKASAALKIPLYLFNIKTGVDYGSGPYINPESSTPDDGYFFAGIEINLAQNLFIDENRSALRQAKINEKISDAERIQLMNELVYDAIKIYAYWKANYNVLAENRHILEVAQERLRFVTEAIKRGEYAKADSVEAALYVQKRQLDVRQSEADYLKSKQLISSMLWDNEGRVLELKENTLPQKSTPMISTKVVETDWSILQNHPKLLKEQLKTQVYEVDRKMALNSLLPKLKLQYYPIYQSRPVEQVEYAYNDNMKASVSFYMPLFLRKSRSKLEQSKLKIKRQKLEVDYQTVFLKQKIEASLGVSRQYEQALSDADLMLKSATSLRQIEFRKYRLGESSLFLVNKREDYIVEAAVKKFQTEAKLLIAIAELEKNKATLWTESGINLEYDFSEN